MLDADTDAWQVEFAPGRAYVKVAGISCERVGDGVCVGIGVDAFALPGSPSPAPVLDVVLAAFAPAYERWCAFGFAPFANQISEQNILKGSTVAIRDALGRTTLRGVVETVNSAGQLLIRDDAGKVNAVSSGEAHIVFDAQDDGQNY